MLPPRLVSVQTASFSYHRQAETINSMDADPTNHLEMVQLTLLFRDRSSRKWSRAMFPRILIC